MRRKRTITGKPKKPKSVQALLISRARQVWAWSAEKREAKALAKTRAGWSRCSQCKSEVPEWQTAIDHTDPVVPTDETGPTVTIGEGARGWDRYYSRLFVPPPALSSLCTPCHVEKTKKERTERTSERRRRREKTK